MRTLEWVSCDGGPHLLAPRELVLAWEGVDEPSNGRVVQARFRWTGNPDSPATDYDAACDIDELLGTVPIDSGVALVLGDDVPMSTWIPDGVFGSGTLVVPVWWPDHDTTDEALLAAVCGVPAAQYVDSGVEISSGEQGFLLFAASDLPSDWAYPTVEVPLPRGTYRLFTAEAEIDGFMLRLHAFKRTDM